MSIYFFKLITIYRRKAIENVLYIMSFFNKIFGGDDKKKEQKEQPVKKAPETADAKMLKI